MSIQRKAYRSKKSGRFFKFEKYYEDGFGKYEDTIDLNDDTPDFVEVNHKTSCEFYNHTNNEVEEVFFTISLTNIDHT